MTGTQTPILVTGASIAGNAVAACLVRHGFAVTLVEQAEGFREGGQNVDVRGPGREVLRRMGLERAALDLNTGERGTAWVDGSNRTIAAFPGQTGDREGFTAEMEILRGDLARLLFDAVGGRATYRFGDAIAAVEEADGGVDVRFRSGHRERFGLVVVAEGVGSATRELVFPGENKPRPIGLAIAYFTIPKGSTDTSTSRWFNAPGGRTVLVRPDRMGTTRVCLSVRTDGETPPRDLDPDGAKRFMRERFADAGWELGRILDDMEAADDLYAENLRQVRMPRWSRGRVVLTGDAAWCATPVAGIGTTLSVVGAYLLAGELSREADHTAAFAAYEGRMRPFVEKRQAVPSLAVKAFNPRSRIGLAAFHAGLRIVSRPSMQAMFAKLDRGDPDSIELPDFGAV